MGRWDEPHRRRRRSVSPEPDPESALPLTDTAKVTEEDPSEDSQRRSYFLGRTHTPPRLDEPTSEDLRDESLHDGVPFAPAYVISMSRAPHEHIDLGYGSSLGSIGLPGITDDIETPDISRIPQVMDDEDLSEEAENSTLGQKPQK